jgi:hypothetical protein
MRFSSPTTKNAWQTSLEFSRTMNDEKESSDFADCVSQRAFGFEAGAGGRGASRHVAAMV